MAPDSMPPRFTAELHAAERAALVEIVDRIWLQFGLLGHGVLAEILSLAGRPIAEVVGTVVVPKGALIVGDAVEDFEMDVGMFEPDAAELPHVFRLEPDREPPVIERLVAEISDPQTRHLDTVLIGIKRAHGLAKRLAHAVAPVGAR